MMLLIDSRLRDSIVSYLAGKPYVEVADGIQALRALEPASEPEPETSTEPPPAKKSDVKD